MGKQKNITMKLFVRMLRANGVDLESVLGEMEDEAKKVPLARHGMCSVVTGL